ncbi:hypothetical protein [Pedobacter sp. GR22-6]|uniref:hypothetical protein n=1 Tax=Pedobacter sp. GR22-6 TaxID=3127957 RepID=UPI00307E09B3
MAIHIGKIIQNLVDKSDFSTQEVASYMSMTTSNLFNIYNREAIDVFKLAKFSELFNTDLFEYYLPKDKLDKIRGEEVVKLTAELDLLKAKLANLEITVKRQDETIEAQKLTIALYKKKMQ